MSRILRKAEEIKEKEIVKDMYIILKKVEKIKKRDDISEEEKKILMSEIMDEKLRDLKKMIEEYKGTGKGKHWDFDDEKKKAIFTEDNVLILRGYRKEDNKYIRQIKKENVSSPELYNDDKVWGYSCDWLTSKNTFVCSIIRKIDMQYIGYISIKDSRKNLWEIAIELLAEQCGKGYGTQAMTLFLQRVSEVTTKEQFQVLVETDNIPSQMLMEKLGARLIDIYDYTFNGDEEAAEKFEEEHLECITDRMIELADQIGVQPRKMLSNVLDYRFFIENGKIVNRRR